jgi:hypothetical protein
VRLRAAPGVLAAAAAVADFASAPVLAFYALVLAVPPAAAAGLAAYGDLIDEDAGWLRACLWPAALELLVVGTAARAPALGEGTVPALATSALLACLALFLAQAVASALQR